MRLPAPRGPISSLVIESLSSNKALARHSTAISRTAAAAPAPLADDDVQLALAVCYELHYRGFDGVDDRWEWSPALLQVRRILEEAVQRTLTSVVRAPQRRPGEAIDVALRRLLDEDDGPSLSAYLARHATAEQFREFVLHRSVYHLKEADPHTWGIPRLTGQAKAALVEIQSDEYGGGRPERMHSALFATTMRALGLDEAYGAYWDLVPATTLATTNLMSLFGLHRRWRGALLGHLAVLEMSSTVPNRRYGNGLRRLGFGPPACAFYDEHVEADAVHEQLAGVDLCGSFVTAEPERYSDVLFGAASCLYVEAQFAAALLDPWQRGQSSLGVGQPVQACA